VLLVARHASLVYPLRVVLNPEVFFQMSQPPIERAILRRVANVLFDSGWGVFNICISKPGIFKLADIETELFDHRLQASCAHICVLEIALIVTVVADEKLGIDKCRTRSSAWPVVPA